MEVGLLQGIWVCFKTSATEVIKFMSLERPHFPTTAKIIVLLYAFFSAASKILVNVAFFIPSLGLFSILNHWKAETLPFSSKGRPMLNEDTEAVLELFNATAIPWASINRWMSEDEEVTE